LQGGRVVALADGLPKRQLDIPVLRIARAVCSGGDLLNASAREAGCPVGIVSGALWEQTAWGWSALQTGLAIATARELISSVQSAN
jgi:hypothetical protein